MLVCSSIPQGLALGEVLELTAANRHKCDGIREQAICVIDHTTPYPLPPFTATMKVALVDTMWLCYTKIYTVNNSSAHVQIMRTSTLTM